MNQATSTISFTYPKLWPIIALIVTTFLSIGVSLYFLHMGTSVVFQNLYYFPILIACIFYQKKGLIFSITLSAFYFFLVILFSNSQTIISLALIRVFIFITIASVVTFLSQMRNNFV